MTDTTDTTVTEPGAGTATEPTEQVETTEPDYRAEAEKWKALARQNEARAKANAEKATRLDQLEEAQKTELQKAEERATAAEQRAAAAILAAEKTAIAAKTGVDPALLAGATPEELQASADALLAWRGTTAPAAPRVGGADINGGAAKPRIHSRADMRNPAYYQANRADILAAQREGGGRITD